MSFSFDPRRAPGSSHGPVIRSPGPVGLESNLQFFDLDHHPPGQNRGFCLAGPEVAGSAAPETSSLVWLAAALAAGGFRPPGSRRRRS